MEPLFSVQLAVNPEEYDITTAMGAKMVQHGAFWALFAFPVFGGETAEGGPLWAQYYQVISRN